MLALEIIGTKRSEKGGSDMPELPEVETVRRTLQSLVVGKTIADVTVTLGRIIRNPDDVNQFIQLLKGQTIHAVDRRAKFLRFVCDDLVLLSHLRMEGRYGVYGAEEPVELHTHVRFHFSDGTELRYKDVRQFGTMDLLPLGEEWKRAPLKDLGIEPLDEAFTFPRFKAILKNRSTKVKPFLLNQSYIVGLGNIYVDESLFAAGIHPERAISSLKKSELERLFHAIRDTLQSAVDLGGSSVKSYVNGQGEMGMFQQQLLVYGKQGQSCMKCENVIQKTVVGGRGTHFCLKCQRYK
jgi:formamidopyrimidine-DNA glycosylase